MIKNAKSFLLIFWLVSISVVSGLIFGSTSVFAYSASLTTDSSVELNVSHLGDGTSVEAKSLRVVSDCRAGYNLSVATDANANLYKDGDSSESAVFTAVDGTSALNSASNTNKWGYTLTNNATSATVFSPLSTTESILKTSSQTASSESDIDDTFPIYYGVKVNDSVAPGIYQMDDNSPIVYYLTMDATCNQYTVSFNANGGTGTIADQIITAGEPTKLSSASALTAPEYESYTDADNNTITGQADKLWTFWGWNTEIDGSGDWYKDRESVTDLAQAGDTITLYAQWKQPTLADLIPAPTPQPTDPKPIDHDTMQDMSTAACFNSVKFTAIGTPYGQTTLKDSRDGTTRTYTVAKLPDGLCWMTQNLNLGASSAITLTSDDTDLAEGTTFTLPASDPNDFTVGTTQAIINKATVLNNITVPDYTVEDTTYSGKINAYYSYAAATADTNTYSIPSFSTVSTSICPKNWDLPTSVQYDILRIEGKLFAYNNTSSSYTSGNAGNEPYYFIYGGYRKAAGSEVSTTTFQWLTSEGYLWKSDSSSTSAEDAFISEDGLDFVSNSFNKYFGLGIRCVANMDKASHTVTYTNTNSGATQTQKIVMGESNELRPTITWARTNYRLVGWDTNSAGTNVVYTTGQSITPNSDMTLYTVWEPTYTLQYNGNGADAGVMTNVKHTNVKEGDVFDLFASNFSKAGYGFAGWSFDQNAQPGGSSRIYGPNEAITAPAPSTPGETKTLYAIWVASSGNLQGWNNCPNMNDGDVIALKDTRDDNVYTVGKLADGNCWMMENLRLNTAGSSDSTKAQGFGTGFIGLADPETAGFSNSTNANSLYSTTNITGSNQGYRFPRFNYANTNARATNPSATDNRNTTTSAHGVNLSSAIYSYGNYYTWAAAKANIEDLTTVASSEAASTSICPSGWRLPYGRTTGSGAESTGFYYLGSVLGATTSSAASSRIWRSYPNNFIYSGYISGSTVSSRGSYSYLWSATTFNGTSAYNFRFSTAGIFNTTSSRYNGYTVRCVMLNPSNLYETVASMSQGPQSNPDFYNDGVNEYVGSDSDGTKQNGDKAKIYVYYGELDTNSPTYGSAGNGEAWPNYVILSSASAKSGLATTDTCWRIIRTTGSGGVKMIYNGKWTGSTCARATTNAQYGTYSFNGTTETQGRQAVRVGFTHNPSYASTSATSSTPVNTLYGSSTNYSGNTTNSTAKTNIQNFYSANLMDYTSILEPNAGYCNDRSSFTSTAGTTATTSFIPYLAADSSSVDGATRLAYYGGYVRNLYAYTPSLECPRGTVDIYSTNTSAGGNGQLLYPAALITADEARLAGMGFDSGAEASYLRTGSDYWTMTPHSRQTRLAYEIYVNSDGGMKKGTGEVYNSKGIRPVVSLIEGTKAVSGSGIATDPWIVNPQSGEQTTYTVTLNVNGGTGGSTEASVRQGGVALSEITNPTKTTTIAGFSLPATNGALSATVSNNASVISTDTLSGWYKEPAATNLIASNSTSPALQANTDYTGIHGEWTHDGDVTLYAGWTHQAVTLPTITKTGRTCGWTTESEYADTIMYASGASITPDANTTLYGVCTCPANKICYDANATGVTGTMGNQQLYTLDNGGAGPLLAQNYSRPGYGFAGWIQYDKWDGELNVEYYGPSSDFVGSEDEGVTLYANWVQSVGNMQDWDDCASLRRPTLDNAEYDIIALTDKRDNNTYAITKLQDGKCWMLENLRLDAANSTDSGLAQGFKSPFTGLANSESSNFSNVTNSNSKYNTSNITGSNQGYRFPRYNNVNTASRAAYPTTGNANIYGYGNYYTFAAANADTTNYTTNNSSTSYSICPKGWYIPKGGDKTNMNANKNDFYNMTYARNGAPLNYDSTTQPMYGTDIEYDEGNLASIDLRRFPSNFVYSGRINGSTIDQRGSRGNWWSSTSASGTTGYRLSILETDVTPAAHSNNKFIGFTVRCIKY